MQRLCEAKLTVATAESLTGGLASYLLVAEPGSGEVVRGGVVSYAAATKHRVLAVDSDVPVVSAECAVEMARGVQELFDTDAAMAFTGVAGPRELEGQPVGTVYVAVALRDDVEVRRLWFLGSPDDIRLESIATAFQMLLDKLRTWTPVAALASTGNGHGV